MKPGSNNEINKCFHWVVNNWMNPGQSMELNDTNANSVCSVISVSKKDKRMENYGNEIEELLRNISYYEELFQFDAIGNHFNRLSGNLAQNHQ